MKSIVPWFAGLLALCASPGILCAEVRLPSIFGDNMVLQAGMPVPVWGKAKPAEKVTVSFAGQMVSCLAGSDGRFKAALAPLAASGTPAAAWRRWRSMTSITRPTWFPPDRSSKG